MLQRAVEEFAATGQKVHTIPYAPEKLAGMWKHMVHHLKEMLGSLLISKVGCML
jgi:hypothetical protein